MSAFSLKLIAVIAMTIDHFGLVLSRTTEYRDIGMFMRLIGRVAFPIYVFFVAEGMRRTKNREMYLLRLGIFAFVSYVPYSLMMTVGSGGIYAAPVYVDYTRTNVFFTLFLGAAAIYAFDFIRARVKLLEGWAGRALGLAAGAALCYLADILNTDYASIGSTAIFATYLAMSVKDHWFVRVIPLGLIMWWLYRSSQHYMFMALSAPLMIMLYNGSHGPKWAKNLKISFYLYYPCHVLAVYALSVILRRQ